LFTVLQLSAIVPGSKRSAEEEEDIAPCYKMWELNSVPSRRSIFESNNMTRRNTGKVGDLLPHAQPHERTWFGSWTIPGWTSVGNLFVLPRL
jgi:hypothetical protein